MKRELMGILMLLALGTVVLMGCGSGSRSPALEDTTWLVESLGPPGSPQAVVESNVSGAAGAIFDQAEGKVTGATGCNRFFASYSVSDNGLTISAVAATEIFCTYPEGVMEQEELYLALLAGAQTYEIQDDRLTIYSADGQVINYRMSEEQ